MPFSQLGKLIHRKEIPGVGSVRFDPLETKP